MKKGIENIVDEIKNSVLTVLIDIVVLYCLNKWLPFFSAEDNYSWYQKAVVLLVLFGILFVFLHLLRNNYYRYKFFFKEEKVIMEYQGDRIIVYQEFDGYTKYLSATKKHTRKVWYSNEKYEFRIETKGFSTEFIRSIGNEDEYYIVFPQKYYWRKPIQFKTVFIGSNIKRQFKNFYWMDIETPTKDLSIEIRMPKACCLEGGKIKRKVFLKHEEAPGNEITEFDFNGYHKWEIENPKLNWSYVLEWEWSESEKELISQYT